MTSIADGRIFIERADAPTGEVAIHTPKLSIITPSFNHARFIRETIESVLTQESIAVEHIVVDGASTDSTAAILREYGERFPTRFRWISEPDGGQSEAFNKGLAMARGTYIGWQNSDDYYLPNAFATAVAYLDEHPDVAVVYGDCLYLDHSGTIVGEWPTIPFDYARLLDYCILANHAAFVRKDVLLACGGLARDLHFTMDYELWLRIGLHHQMAYVPGYIGVWRLTDTAKTNKGIMSNRLEHVTSLDRTMRNPAFPAAMLAAGKRAHLRHVARSAFAALASNQPELARELLAETVEQDVDTARWHDLVASILTLRTATVPTFGEFTGHDLDLVPTRLIDCLLEIGLSGGAQFDDALALRSVFQALEPPGGRLRIAQRFGLLWAALLRSRRWLSVQPAATMVLLRLLVGDAAVDASLRRLQGLRTRRHYRKIHQRCSGFSQSRLPVRE